VKEDFRMKRLPIAALLLLGACATDTPAPTPGPASVVTAQAPVGAAVGQSVETTSIVESVDQKTRQVLLRLEDGTYMTLKVPASVRGLGQVKAGDRVVARVTRAIAVDIAKADGSAPIEAGEIETQAPKGLPAGALLRAVRVRVIVDSVSADGKQVSVTTPRGVTRTIDITDPKMIAFVKTLKPGEPVNAVFAEAFSLKVLPPNASTVAPPVRAAK
jgi:hypothetical protein